MSKGQEETNTTKNGPVIQGQVHAIDHSPCVSDSSDGDEELDEESALEYILRGKQDFLTSKIKLPSGSSGNANDVRTKIDPDTQARLEALLEAAGVAKLADGKAFADPDVLRRLTSSVSSALDEAAAALTRMRTQNNGVPSSPNHTADAGIHSLANACLEGNVNAVRKLLEQGWSVHDSTDEGESLLSLACSAGYCELAQVLLAMNAKVDDRGSKGDCTPLMEASSGGFLDIVHLLLDHEADVNAQSQAGNTALIYACCGGYEDVVKVLLDHEAEIESHNENGHTPLMEAASGGHVNVAKLLLERGACINSHSNEFKESALTLACYKGHVDMVKFLLDAGADQEHKTDEMHTALMEASMDGHVEVARLLLDHGAEVNMPADSFESPLTLAACGGHVDLASLLIERDAFLEEVNDEGYTPLMEAAREGHIDMVALLLDKGADLHAQTDETQETALSLTCCGGFQDVAAYLLDRGANIEQGSSTPLMEAAQEGHVDLVKFVLEKGADVNATTGTGDTPLSFACENGHTDVADILLEVGAELEHESEGGRTPLMKAARAGHLCTVQFLISRGADVNRATTTNDHTVLSLACAGGYLAAVELLLAHGAKPDHILKDNSTMLLEACKGGHTSVARLLMETPLHGNHPEYHFTAIQPPSSPSSPPRVPPVHSLDQLDPNLPLPGLNCTHHDLLPSSSIMVPPGLLPSTGVPMTDDKLGFLTTSLYKNAFLNELEREMPSLTPEEQQRIEAELERVKHEALEITTPPSPFRLDPISADVDSIGDGEESGASDDEASLHSGYADNSDDGSPCEYVGPSSMPLTPTPSPASPTFVPAIDIEQQTESNHDTALSMAAAGGHDDLVKLLLQRGSELEHRDKKGCTPLILSATGGHASTVQMLLDQGADIEAQSDRTKDTALSLACSGGRQEAVEVLIAGSANFEHRNVSDYTPLSLAASGGYIGIVKILLAHGAEINSRTGSKLGISPLMLASMNGHTATVKLLLDMGADINAQIETNRNTALTLACFQGRHEVVSLLVERRANIEHRAKTGLTPLMEAASGGYIEVGRVLLEKGADVNAPPVPSSRDTALTIAADKGHQKFCDLLLSRGAIVEVRNKKGSTPLWLAANGGHLEVCQLLARYSADVNSQDNRKVSVLMAAFRKGHVKTVKWIVRHVTQFPSESDSARFISTLLNDKELLKKCQQCMNVIRHAKDLQEKEAAKNASILLQQVDMEKEREEVKKQAAARRREKKKKKKKNKLAGKDENDKVAGKEEDGEDDEEPMVIVKEESEESPQEKSEDNAERSPSKKDSPSGNRTKKEAMDTLTSIAITTAVASGVSGKHVDRSCAVTTSEITKAVASTMYTSTSRISDISPITVATAAAQCVTVTLTTTSPIMSSSTTHSRIKASPRSWRGRKHDEGWNVVIRRSKKLSVPSSVISRVIGRGGCNVNAIRDATGAHVDIDTSNQKATGTCTVTIKGAVESTRQAHHLILTLIKDPECDINDHLPRAKHSQHTPTSHRLTFEIPAASTHSTAQETSRVSRVPATSVSPNTSSSPVAIPASRDTTYSRPEKRPRPASNSVSSSHLPGNVRWASPTYQAPAKTTSVSDYMLKQPGSVPEDPPTISGRLTLSGRSPAARQLVFPSDSSPPSVQTTRLTSSTIHVTSSTTRVTSSSTRVTSSANRVSSSTTRVTSSKTSVTSSTTRVTSSSEYRSSKLLSYSNVAGGVVPANGDESSVVELSDDSLNGAALPPVISSILSQVCQNRSPIVWNEGYYPKTIPENEDLLESIGESGELSQPLSIATSGGLFKPLPHEVSPPNPSSTSPASSSSPIVNTTPSPPAAMATAVEEKPIQPIGTERAAHRRTNTSPSPTLTGVPPLISSEGTGGTTNSVWSYHLNTSPSSAWPTTSLDNRAMPSPPLVAMDTSTSPRPIPSSAIPPARSDASLQEFLDRLGLSNYLALFQKNEIDLEALLLMNEEDCVEIGLPKGPSTRLLNSIRRMYSPRVYSRHDVYRPEIPYTAIRPNYPCTVRSPLVSANMTWRQPLPQRPVLLQPQSVPNGSIPNNPEMYNGGHGSGVWNAWSRTAI